MSTITEQHPTNGWHGRRTTVPGTRCDHLPPSGRQHYACDSPGEINPDGFVEEVADELGILNSRVKGDLQSFKEFIEQRGRKR